MPQRRCTPTLSSNEGKTFAKSGDVQMSITRKSVPRRIRVAWTHVIVFTVSDHARVHRRIRRSWLQVRSGIEPHHHDNPGRLLGSGGAVACDRRIELLHRETDWHSEFHFKRNPDHVREAFIRAVVPYNFFYYGIVIDKERQRHLADQFPTRGTFYQYA
jgi:hypothetical protein